MRPTREFSALALLSPALLLLAVVLIWPVIDLTSRSFLAQQGAWAFYGRLFAVPTYFEILLRTLVFSAATAMISLLVAYPVAYKLTTTGQIGRAAILICVLVPFWTNLLVRSYGWLLILNPKGIINTLLLNSGLVKAPLDLVYNETGVIIGMTHIMLPYAILPLYAVMTRLDPRLTNAARSLGAGPIATFWKIYFPLTMPGVMAAVVLVFTISLGFFVIPAILGGARGTFVAQLIEFNINSALNWGMASALSTTLLVATLLLYWIGDRWLNLGAIWGLQR